VGAASAVVAKARIAEIVEAFILGVEVVLKKVVGLEIGSWFKRTKLRNC